MIELRTGDIFDEDVEALVNSVNCVGVMGRGIALQFKNIFPANFKAYAEACKRQEVQPGRMFVSTRRGKMVGAPRYIINFPYQAPLARPRVAWRTSRQDSMRLPRKSPNATFAPLPLPPLGSGLGGLELARWSDSRIESSVAEHWTVLKVLSCSSREG